MDLDSTSDNKGLPNRPERKLSPLHKGSRIQKRPLTRRSHLNLCSVDSDGYTSPSFRGPAANTVTPGSGPACIFVSTKSPFMMVVKRVRKTLDYGPLKSTRGLPLTARIAALCTSQQQYKQNGRKGGGVEQNGEGGGGKEVIVLGMGRAIEKTLGIAAYFNREKDCRVSLRTRSVAVIDDVLVGGDAEDGNCEGGDEGDDDEVIDDHARVRMVSCLEVAVRLQ